MANTAINHDPVATFPGSSTNTAVVKWSGTSGNALLDSGVIIDGSNNVTGLNNVTATGYLHLTGDEKELRFYEGANYIAIAAPSGLGADYTFTLPLNDGAADEFLQTNGSGVLTWAAAAGTTINSNADNRVITGSGTANTLNGETGLTFSAGQLTVDSGATNVSAIVSIEVSASATSDPLLRWREGSGNGDANNQQYEAWMDVENGQFRFRSQNIDGSSSEGDVWTINDGTNDVKFNGKVNVIETLFINDTANANQTAGITINQTTNDNHILSFKSGGDVNTGLTTLPSQDVEIDDYAIFKKSHPTKGGLVIYGLNTNNTRALDFYGYAGADNTAKNVNASSHNSLSAIRHNNSNALAAFTSNSNIFMLEKVDSGGSAARFLWDVEGSAHADVEWTTYDDYNDIELLRGIHGALTPDYKTTFGQDMMYNLSRYEDLGFVGKDSVHWEDREDGRHQLRGMVNFTQLSMLHHSTIIQMADQFTARIESLETQLKALQAAQEE